MVRHHTGYVTSQGGWWLIVRCRGVERSFFTDTGLLRHLIFFAFNLCNFVNHINPNNIETVYYVPGCANTPPVRRTLYGHVLYTDVDNISTYCTSRLFAKIES